MAMDGISFPRLMIDLDRGGEGIAEDPWTLFFISSRFIIDSRTFFSKFQYRPT